MLFQIILALAFILALWTTNRLTALSKMKWPGKTLVLCGTMIVLCAPLLIRDRGSFDGTGYIIAYYTAYFFFICFVLFATLLIARDICWLACSTLAKMTKHPKNTLPYTRETLVRANIWTFAIAFFLSIFALHEGTKIPRIHTTTITTTKVEQPLNIVVLSDLHLHRTLFPQKVQGIVDKTNALQPDIILLPGDTIDDYPERIQPLLTILSGLKATYGVFATHGNHEFYVNQNKSKEALENIGATFLSNNGMPIADNLFVGGIPDHQTVRRFGGKADIPAALTGSTPDMYRILLSHQPKIAPEAAAAGVDLQVSGHTHGGQIFPFHFITKLVNHYLHGAYRVGDMTLSVSTGSGQWGPQMRLFAPSEIVQIRLQPNNMAQQPKKKTKLPIFVPTPLNADPSYFPPIHSEN